MAAPISFSRRIRRKLPRVVKAARQWTRALASGGRPESRLVFIVGAQRSGTRLPLELLDASADVATFSEGVDPYFDRVLLRPLDVVEACVRRSPARVIALKPICETHRTIELLDRFPGSKAIWIFRHFEDTVNSATVKWTSGRAAVRRLARREYQPTDWRAGGLTEETLRLVGRLYDERMSEHEANAVLWYLRNDLFFALGADQRADVLLVRYEDLMREPRVHAARLLEFAGVPVPVTASAAVRVADRPRKPFPEISPEIRRLCEDVHERLLAHYRAALNRPALAANPVAVRPAALPPGVRVSAERTNHR